MPSKFTHARNTNGKVQRIPRAWLAEGSPFRDQFTQTSSSKSMTNSSAPKTSLPR